MDSVKVEEKKSLKSKLALLAGNTRWAFSQLFAISKRDTVLLLVFSVLIAILPTFTAYASSRIFNQIVQIITDVTGKTNVDPISVIFTQNLIVIIVINAVVQGVATFSKLGYRYMDRRFRGKHLRVFDNIISAKISQLDVQFFEDPKISNMIQKARENSWRVRDYLDTCMDMVTDVVAMMASAVVCFSISPELTLILIVISIPRNISYSMFIKEWWKQYHFNVENNRMVNWIKSGMTSDKQIAENKVLGVDKYMIKDMTTRSVKLFDSDLKPHTRKFVRESFLTILDNIVNLGVTLYLLYLTVIRKISSVGDLIFFVGRFDDFTSKLGSIAGLITDLNDNGLGLSQVKSLFDLDNRIKSGKKKVKSVKKPPIIEFKNVWFKYPNTEKYVLRNLNITINSKEEIAIVGENGAGKSTFIRLLMRFYDPTKGEILIDGVNLKQLDLQSYYSIIGTLFQDYNAYGHYDVRTNVALGLPKQKVDMEKVRKAVRFAEAEKFVDKLEYKYDQVLHKSFTKGTNLSGGQWQKIAIARMFYRDAPVLILDEPTASIDAVSEYNIFRRIYKFMTGKTVIIISHRFSTVRNAQRIFILHDGKIVEQGTHNELLKLDGRYAHAFNLQAGGYSEENS